MQYKNQLLLDVVEQQKVRYIFFVWGDFLDRGARRRKAGILEAFGMGTAPQDWITLASEWSKLQHVEATAIHSPHPRKRKPEYKLRRGNRVSGSYGTPKTISSTVVQGWLACCCIWSPSEAAYQTGSLGEEAAHVEPNAKEGPKFPEIL